MSIKEYGYAYFCGANAVVSVNDFPVLEAAGISYNVIDSTPPVYGYSSKLFDGVAAGQVIVQGSLVTNFVHHDYLFECISWGLSGNPTVGQAQYLEEQGFTPYDPIEYQKLTEDGIPLSQDAIRNAEEQFWTLPTLKKDTGYEQLRSMSPLAFSPINISISFGKRYTIDLLSAFFIGRGSTIQIDENTIMEEYPFFARQMKTRYHNETR